MTGMQLTFVRAIYLFWIRSPETLLVRQVALLLIVWVHACIGLHTWLRLRPLYHRWGAAIGAFALG